jgi:tetratricopeptide (TPR) repeat protein
MSDDWYRRTTWTQTDEDEFFARLNRSRGQFHKAQYLRIQAHYLQKEFPEEALKLLELIIEEYPEPFELSSTYLQKAQCLVAINQKLESLLWFRKVLESEEKNKGVQTTGYLDYPTFIVSEEMEDLYPEAKSILTKYVDRLMFPVDRYRWNMAMAIIEWNENNRSEASKFAALAIEASSEEKSGFRYHPNIGLVKSQDKRIQKLLNKISKAQPAH